MSIVPRIQLFEINDEPWLPSVIRQRVQECLTLFWTLHLPPLQGPSPAQLVGSTIKSILGSRIHDFTFVDFCSGAGGPTPWIERNINEDLKQPVDFILTDIEPHVHAWQNASADSSNLFFVPSPVDAADPPEDLIAQARSSAHGPKLAAKHNSTKTFRLFFLSFHHMPDPIAGDILRSALEAPDCSGLGIFELQGRTLGEFFMVCVLGPLLWIVTPIYFWQDPIMLLLVYLLPIVPFIVVFDGIVSCLRTRTAAELVKQINDSGASCDGWQIRHGEVVHSWPFGFLRYFVLLKND